MNPRERLLAIGLLSFVLVGGGVFLFNLFYLVPLGERETRLAALRQDNAKKEEQIQAVLAAKPRLERWRQLSLPADQDLARREYAKFLGDLCRDSGFAPGNFTIVPKPVDIRSSPTLPNKKEPIFIRLAYTVQAHAELAAITRWLRRFYQTPLLHQVSNLSVQRPLTGGSKAAEELSLNLTVEALVMNGAEKRPRLLPEVDRRLVALDVLTTLLQGPGALALVPWTVSPAGALGPGLLAHAPEAYALIPAKNIFFGHGSDQKEEIEVAQFVYLTDIIRSGRKVEAHLYNRYDNIEERLRAAPGLNLFHIPNDRDEQGPEARVMRLDDRDMYFRVGEAVYVIHVGENLSEAMKNPLQPAELKALRLEAGSRKR